MKRAIAVLVVLCFATLAWAAEYYIGVLTASSGSVSNVDAGTPFQAASKMTVVCTAPVVYRACSKASTCTAVSTDFPIPSGTAFDIDSAPSLGVPFIAVAAQDGGAFSCNVYGRR